MYRYKKLLAILLINTLFMGSIYCQEKDLLNHIKKQLDSGNEAIAMRQLKELDSSLLKKNDKPRYYHLMANASARQNNEDQAYKHYLIAKREYLKIDSLDRAMAINLEIANLLSAQDKGTANYNVYVDEYMAYAEKSGNKQKIANGYFTKGILAMDNKQPHESLALFKNTLQLSEVINDDQLSVSVKNYISALYNEYLNKPDSALIYLQDNLKYLTSKGSNEDLCYNYINQAASYYYMGQYKKAINLLETANSLHIKEYVVKTKQYIYESLYKNYEAIRDYKKAFDYLLLAKKFADSASVVDQNIAISDIQTKYQTKEKEVENLQLKEKITNKNILLYTFVGLLLVSSVIGWLVIKNSRRKQKILEQEKLIEQQKLEKALKDYELSSIDMMLEGQEKERQRIANDLHDNLGSMLATLKLNFENLKLRKNELREEETKLYERTDELIEEAYQKVRRLAHAKNAGVLANEGLIPALIKLAEKISIPGKLNIEVIPFGFNERIENSLEITIFRMVQELATNIIKHSKATEATIHLTRHEDNINIIIEDNGIGLKQEEIIAADGMGITSIKRKCEQLGGTMTIDSTPGKGTTIIIDIPV